MPDWGAHRNANLLVAAFVGDFRPHATN